MLNLDKINLATFGVNEEEQQRQQAAKFTMSEALKVNPDAQARINKLSTESGIPPFAVKSDPEDTERRLKLDKIDFNSMSKRRPNTVEYLVDFNNAAIAHDDIDVLGKLEDVLNLKKTFQGSGESTKLSFESQARGLAIEGAKRIPVGIKDLAAFGLQGASAMLAPHTLGVQDEVAQTIVSYLGLQNDVDLERVKAEFIESQIKNIREIKEKQAALMPEDLNTVEQGVRAGFESLVNMAPGTALMLASGGRVAPLLATMGAQAYGQSYGEALVEGKTHQEASLKGGIDAAIEVGTELLPVGTLARVITGKAKGMTKEALKFAVQEMSTEQLATIGQSLNDYAFGLDEQMEQATDVAEMAQIQLQRQAVTAIATIVAGGAQITAAAGIRKTINALTKEQEKVDQQSEIEQTQIDQLAEGAENSKLRERDRQAFKQFVQKADGQNNTTVFIDAVQTSLYLQNKTPEQIAADETLKMLQENVQEAAVLGGDIAVPVAEFATLMPGHEAFQSLRDSMTMSEDTVAPFRQEQAKQETQQYIQGLMAEAEQNVSEYVEAQDVYVAIRDQLVDTGMVNEKNAGIMTQIVPAWATVYAKKNGISVKEAFDRSGLTIEGPMTGRAVSDEALAQESIKIINSVELPDGRIVDGFEAEIHDDGKTVGIVQAEKISNDTIQIFNSRFDENYRGKGLGKKAYIDIINAVRNKGFKNIVSDNAVSILAGNVWESLGAKKNDKVVLGDGRFADIWVTPDDSPIFEFDLTKDKKLFQETRGYYDPANATIRMTEAADLSTFLHEFAHFMLEMERKVGGDTIQSINNWQLRNAKAVAKEAGTSEEDVQGFINIGSTGDKNKDEAINRAIHEQFARGFETYLMEGKAPSIELRNAFRSFARWLNQIYQSIRGNLNVNLDKDIRQVFDRLLATEEQIAAAEAQLQYAPMFKDAEQAKQAGMETDEFSDYQKQQEKIKDKQTETLRDKMVKEITRQQETWWKEQKNDLVIEETNKLKNERVYKARNALLTGEMKLDLAETKAMIGEEYTTKKGVTGKRVPSALRNMTKPGGKGIHPDQAAGLLGYSSGAEMLKDLVDSPKLKDLADSNAEARMREQYGDILNDGTIQQLATEAVTNEERGKLILQELKALTRKVGTPTIDRAAIKELAIDRIGKLSFREIHPGRYHKAEVKAAQEAATALAAGDTDTALRAKTQQAINYYLFMEAMKAKTKIMKIVEHTARYNKKEVRQEIQKAENGYWEQIAKILDRFEFRKSASLKSVDTQAEALHVWAKDRIESDGDGLVLSPVALNETYVTHWKNVPFADLQSIHDTVKNIEHVARYSNKITRQEEEMTFQELVTRWVNSIYSKKKRKFKSQRTDVIEGRNFGRWAMAQMTKIPFLASWLDGGERAGLSHDILVQPFVDAYDKKLQLWETSGKVIMDMILDRDADTMKRHNRKIFIPEIQTEEHDGNLMGHQVLAVALNTGNLGNLRKLLLGEGWANAEDETSISFDNPKLQAVLRHMTKQDWELVQAIWDQMDTLYPQLAEVHRRTTGLTPPKVEATPVVTAYGTFKGGYYPIKYDPYRSRRARANEDRLNAETESMFTNGSSIQASVNAGATNERTKFYDAIRLSLDVVPNHFDEVIHYITHHDAVREVNKLIKNSEVEKAIIETLGREEFAQLKPWLNDIAKDGREAPAKSFIDTAMQRLRNGVTLGTMGFKASTGIIQLAGLSNSIAELGFGPVYQSLRMILGRSTKSMQDAWDFASSNSKVLKHRTKTMDREIKNAMSILEQKRGILAAAQEASMKHIALIQTYMVDLPTWHAAYIKSMKEHGDEQRAFKHADWIIENVQGSGNMYNMASIMRSKTETHRMFTMFMTFFSSLWNLSRDLKEGTYSSTTIAAKMMFLYTVPVLFEMMMRGELGAPDDGDDDERLQKFTTNLALYPLASVPLLRDVASGVIGDYGYNMTPLAALIEGFTRSAPGLAKGLFTDEEITKAQVKGVVKFAGAAAGLPGINQVWATGEHLYQVMEEGEELTMQELLYGPKRD